MEWSHKWERQENEVSHTPCATEAFPKLTWVRIGSFHHIHNDILMTELVPFFFFFTTNMIGELFSLLHFTSKLKRAVNMCHLILFWTSYQSGFYPYHSSKSAPIKAQMTSKHLEIQGSPLSPHLVWSKANVWYITFLFCSLFSLTSITSFFFKN